MFTTQLINSIQNTYHANCTRKEAESNHCSKKKQQSTQHTERIESWAGILITSTAI